MKFNKKFLGIFLGLSMVFCSSVLVSARNIVEVEEDEIQSVEPCVEKADKKLAEYIKGSLKKGEKLTKNKFEEKKEKSVRLAKKDSENQKLKLEKLESLLKPLEKTSKKESAYKDIINFRIEETKEKIKDKVGYSEKERDLLKKELEKLKKLSQKEELSDLEKSGLKANLETSIIMAKSDLNDVKKFKKDVEKVKYEATKKEIAKM